MKTRPAIMCAAALAAALSVLLAACAGTGSFESDPSAISTVEALAKKMNSGAKLTPAEFESIKAVHEKYPASNRGVEVYRQALTQREDWLSLEKVLTESASTATEEDKLLLGKVYMKLGKYAEARDTFAKMDSPPDVERASMLASAYFHTGENKKAAETLDSVWKEIVAQKYTDALVLRGLLHFYEQNNDKAIEILESVTANEPGSIAAHNALARVYAQAGNAEKAAYHSKAVEEAYKALTEKTGRQGRMVDKMFRLQEAYKAGRHEEVIEIASSIVDSADPRNKAALYGLLANSYKALGMSAKAQEAADKARQLSSK
ncbi:MAG: tetratricopeptide repeat protein [Acidobacteriota bacterium]|nr:MAG: tetratricopeptide repeat protein [Acidobacteriota bacterium]